MPCETTNSRLGWPRSTLSPNASANRPARDERQQAATSLAAIELRVDEQRRCPRCQGPRAVARGRAPRRHYSCKACGRTFNALTGTPLSGLHRNPAWLRFGQSGGFASRAPAGCPSGCGA